MYSTHNEEKLVLAARFIKALKSKINKNWQLMIVNRNFHI